ncbi:MAG: copper amine oxidase N-terminal domain-containing protein [Muribaculaceae bacterium]|nr:copper amine oxidase N-terminal domain-containing protein [Muribaculaceae bacterium]
MKNKFFSFLAGALVMLTLVALPVSALASDGALSLKVYPINILVDGEVFQPTDANGNKVMVFTYNGTTYAPLRALAEAYGLDVGYDAKSNTASVTNPAKVSGTPTVADSFSSVWTVKEKPVTNYGSEKIFTATYNGSLSTNEFKSWWKSLSAEEITNGAEQLAAEAQSMNPGYTVTMYFSYGQYNLGTAYGFEGYQQSNFQIASLWIK